MAIVIIVLHDPLGLLDCAVIVASLVFHVWWFSPRQRRLRRRQRARERWQMRRLFAESAADDADRVPILVDRGDLNAPRTGDYRIGALWHSASTGGEVVQGGHGLSAG